MKQVRKSVFETNSSSTHSLTILSKEQFDNWKAGEVYKKQYGDRFYNKDEFNKLVEDIAIDNYVEVEDVFENIIEYELPQTYKEYCNDDYMEVDVNRHKTQSGEELVIVCKYGRNG